MDLEHLFSNIVEEFNIFASPIFTDDYNGKFEDDLKKIEGFINRSYESNDDDIEDFYDLISIINSITKRCFNYYKKDSNNISKMLRMRVYAKKMVKKKFRDYKYNGRQFWNYNEAPQQYSNGVEYVWKPSVNEIKNLIESNFD